MLEIDASHIKEEIVECDPMVVEETVEVMTHESPVKTPVVKHEPEPPTRVELPKLDLVRQGLHFFIILKATRNISFSWNDIVLCRP